MSLHSSSSTCRISVSTSLCNVQIAAAFQSVQLLASDYMASVPPSLLPVCLQVVSLYAQQQVRDAACGRESQADDGRSSFEMVRATF